jgi:hypothetical protein
MYADGEGAAREAFSALEEGWAPRSSATTVSTEACGGR